MFLGLANERFGKNVEGLEPALVARMQAYPWPGNARELKAVIDRLVLLYEGAVLRDGWWAAPSSTPLREAVSERAPTGSAAAPFRNDQERREIARRLLAESDNNYTRVASQPGINTTTLWRWRKAGRV